MDQLTLPNKSIFFMSDGFGIEPQVYKGTGNNRVYKGVAVFRSGTFRDSMGTQDTWEELHIKQMIDNYDFLSRKNILSSVPARDGHAGFLINNIPGKGAVVGWHQNVESKKKKSPVDGQEYSYLLVDYEITEPYALDKINNGTWRNRSAEVGGYKTNNESEFWPVYMGFAFVDFPAVEGLNFSSSQGKFYAFFGGSSRENNVADSPQTGVLPPLPQIPPTQQQSAPVQTQNGPAPFVFSVAGQNTTDPNQVQAYVRQLEQFAADTRAAGRKSFVAGLVSGNKIAVTQQADQEKFALTLNDEQYAQWVAGWNITGTMSLLANHGGTVTNPDNSGQGQVSAEDTAIATAREIVKMHQRAGFMKPAQIEATSSYQLLKSKNLIPA